MTSISFGGIKDGSQIKINNGSTHLLLETPSAPQSTILFRRDPDLVNRGRFLDQIHEKSTGLSAIPKSGYEEVYLVGS
ncbi:uncharacterized protein N7483_007982 [Penicillium malachiteum]|uniref:uncharacterized protein n=1 Tax=Penicillium malachiteum TaxID=1324776 RepID=UPI0025482669|nr:uncharacterized protein N7483_007982 [Penicillium malachiteum]KAJ5726625.1 hypothetical protein N7483_007982 [Penicillium malachiteum]